MDQYCVRVSGKWVYINSAQKINLLLRSQAGGGDTLPFRGMKPQRNFTKSKHYTSPTQQRIQDHWFCVSK